MSKKKVRTRPLLPEPFFTTERLAIRWDCHPETIRRRVKFGELRASFLLGGRQYRFSLSDVEAYEAKMGQKAEMEVA